MKKIKTTVLYFINYIKYIFSKLKHKSPNVYGLTETLELLRNPRVSCGRFGDGEISLIYGSDLGFQKYNEKLALRLKEIIQLPKENYFLVCLPDVFGDLSFCKPEAKKFWHENIVYNRERWCDLLVEGKLYYNSFTSRFYSLYLDKSHCPKCVGLWKKVWDKKRLLIVEGEGTRLGVGNDLLDNASIIKRILCPAENAWDKYDEILGRVLDIKDNFDVVLVALGPTATVLCYDLHKQGVKAIDVGHIDLEYEWYKLGTTTRVAIEGKYVNEVKGANVVVECFDISYKSQIICEIGE